MPDTVRVLLLIMVTLLVAACSGDEPAGDVSPSDSVVAVVTDDLAARSGWDRDHVRLVRAGPVTWSNACLGAPEAGELCAQVLTDGWVLWFDNENLAAKPPVETYRYHTDLTGAAIRLGAHISPPAGVNQLPLPDGATPRPTEE